MLHLKERTQNIQCPLHYESIKFININVNYPYERRAMCQLCDVRELHYNMEKAEQIILDLECQKKNQLYRFFQKKDQQLQELISEANKITQKIIDQVQKQVSIIKEQVSKIERQFKECRSKLMPHSVFDNFVDSLRNTEQLQLRDIQEMGELLSEPQQCVGQFDQQVVEQLDGRIRLLKEFLGHPKQYDEQNVQKFRKSQDWINSISLNYDETLILSGTDAMEKNLILWRLENNEWKFKEYIEGLNESISHLEFSKTTNNFLTLGKNKKVTLWRCNSHGKYQQMQNLEESANLIRINSNDTFIGTCLGTKIIIYQLPTNWKPSKIQTIETQQHLDKNISVLAFNRNSKKLVVASGNMILVYEQEGKVFNHFQTIQQQSYITALDFCQSGEFDQLILSQKDKIIQIWEMKCSINNSIENKFKYLQTLDDHTNVVLALSSNLNRNVFASSSYDNSIKLWCKPLQDNKWKCFQTIQQVNGISQGQPTNQIIFSNNSRYLFIKQLNSVIEYHIL